MPYPYPRYNGEADAEAHIRAYLTTWQANHASKRLGLVEANISKIAEFGLSLDGQAASWYSQNDIAEFADFDQLREEFVQLFHRRIPQRDLMSQFYAIVQEVNEVVPQFVIHFQNLSKQLTCGTPRRTRGANRNLPHGTPRTSADNTTSGRPIRPAHRGGH